MLTNQLPKNHVINTDETINSQVVQKLAVKESEVKS